MMMRKKMRESLRSKEGSVTMRCGPGRAGAEASSVVVLLEELGICMFSFFVEVL